MIALVDDDPDFREEIAAFLTTRGFDLRLAADGAGLKRLMSERAVSLVVLDVMLQASGESGLEISRRLRARSRDLGIVLLTCLDQPADHVRGLDTGADAYVAKGGDLLVLEATVRNVLARREDRLAPPAAWTLDLTSWELRAGEGESVALTHLERLFLHTLMSAPRGATPRGDLLEAMGKQYTLYENRNLDNVVRRLRRKVEKTLDRPLPVRSAYGRGYAFGAAATIAGVL